MKYKFNTIKRELTLEEKQDRLDTFFDDGYTEKDIKYFSDGCKTAKDFLNKVMYYEYVQMKCTKCDFSPTADYDMLLEIMEFEDMDYPILECPMCGHKKNGGELIPLDICNLKKGK